MKKKTIEKQIEIFRLVLTGTGEIDKLRTAEYIRSLNAAAQRDLREACRRLDQMLLDAAVERGKLS
jgi:hypothetical protein